MLAHETCGAVVVDDELEWLIKPTVLAVSMPVLVCTLFQRDGCGIIKTNDERSRFDVLEGLRIG
jgi:hypothetical protein